MSITDKIDKVSSRIDHSLTRIDNKLAGFLIGAILPVIVFFIYHQVKFSHFSVHDFFRIITRTDVYGSFIKVFLVFGNVPAFFIFNFFRKFNTCIGLFIASILYILSIFIIV